ncbi:hypothetical protein BN159_4647 [Streptomyces davaonensis JCM 4913]|uniref:Uncharacterized protein n=1 Tax=Streptomyces davaonensis (strain DSM 101723 / JCM 4913 / KCC S-0913 / 768) TaxID=1214101 RepID=K4QY86_STRDJ|nr:hypothetical protein BN159_4647 [Streptomyces davaonensis JCM 4913]
MAAGVPVDGHGCGVAVEPRTALEQAVRKDRAGVVRVLAAAGADLGQRVGDHGETSPLCLAAMLGRTTVAEALLDSGADPDGRDRIRQLPLILAATSTWQGYPRTVGLLLRHGADIEGTMRSLTALEWAAGFGQAPMVRLLLDRGASAVDGALARARASGLGRRFPERRGVYGRVASVLEEAADGRITSQPSPSRPRSSSMYSCAIPPARVNQSVSTAISSGE